MKNEVDNDDDWGPEVRAWTRFAAVVLGFALALVVLLVAVVLLIVRR